MSYLGSWAIDDWLTFYCNTHRVDTGVATDADAVPTWRIYEDETGTAIANGNMALLDNANTTGFYSERVQLLAATGFEKGRQYGIYQETTINGVTVTTHDTFQIEAEVDANTVSGTVTPADDSITAAKIATGAVDADAIAADAITAAKLATDCITSDELATSALTEIAASVWNRLTTALTTAGSVGKLIVDNLAASGSLAVAVWNNSTRTLTQSAASVAATVSGSDITITRGDTFTASLTGVGSLAGRSKLWVTFRRDRDDPDSYSLAQIEETDGLIYVNGAAAATAANGSITVSDEDDGDLTITIDEAETVNFAKEEGHYDIQVLIGGAVTTKSAARYAVAEDVTRAIS